MKSWIYVSGVILGLLTQVISGYGGTWQITLTSFWWAYSRSQKAYCTVCSPLSPGTARNLAHFTFLCLDEESLPDYMAITVQIEILPSYHVIPVTEIMDSDIGQFINKEMLVVSVYTISGENVYEKERVPLRGRVEVFFDVFDASVPNVLSRTCAEDARVASWYGEWALTDWDIPKFFLVFPDQVWAAIDYEDEEFSWGVNISVVALENWRTGAGFSNSEQVVFLCKRVP